jgi:predicted nucleic acid-binding protein
MQQEYNTVIADTSCFILLDKIDMLPTLHELFGTITTTPEIATEFGKPLHSWVNIQSVHDTSFQKAIAAEVDKGEASAISLALELQPSLLIIDDLKGRKLAHRLNLTFTGTLGLLLKAKEKGIILHLRPVFEKIQSTNFRIAPKLYIAILQKVGEWINK